MFMTLEYKYICSSNLCGSNHRDGPKGLTFYNICTVFIFYIFTPFLYPFLIKMMYQLVTTMVHITLQLCL